MREPLSQKQVEVIKEKWLVIDQFVRLDRPVKKDMVRVYIMDIVVRAQGTMLIPGSHGLMFVLSNDGLSFRIRVESNTVR